MEVDNGERGLAPIVDAVTYDTTANPATQIGTTYWDAIEHTVDLRLSDTVTLQLGQEQLVRVRNGTAAPMIPGQVVREDGAQGDRLRVALATASTEQGSTRTLGLVTEPIPAGQEGFITTSGLLTGLNTDTIAQGSTVWLGIIPGTYTQTRPPAPSHGVLVGFCIRQHPNAGIIYVHVQVGFEIDELHDVLIVNPQDGDVLTYNASLGLWMNTQPT